MAEALQGVGRRRVSRASRFTSICANKNPGRFLRKDQKTEACSLPAFKSLKSLENTADRLTSILSTPFQRDLSSIGLVGSKIKDLGGFPFVEDQIVVARAEFSHFEVVGSLGAGTALLETADLDIAAMFRVHLIEGQYESYMSSDVLSNKASMEIAKAMESCIKSLDVFSNQPTALITAEKTTITVKSPYHHKSRLCLRFENQDVDLLPALVDIESFACAIKARKIHPEPGVWIRHGSNWLVTYSLNCMRCNLLKNCPEDVRTVIRLLKIWAIAIRGTETLHVLLENFFPGVEKSKRKMATESRGDMSQVGELADNRDVEWASFALKEVIEHGNSFKLNSNVLTNIAIALFNNVERHGERKTVVTLFSEVMGFLAYVFSGCGEKISLVLWGENALEADIFTFPYPKSQFFSVADFPESENGVSDSDTNWDDPEVQISEYLWENSYDPPYCPVFVEDPFVFNDLCCVSSTMPSFVLEKYVEKSLLSATYQIPDMLRAIAGVRFMGVEGYESALQKLSGEFYERFTGVEHSEMREHLDCCFVVLEFLN